MSVASVASVAITNLLPPAGPAPSNPAPALPPPAGPALTSSGASSSGNDSGAPSKSDTAAIEAARQALASAESLVAQDERNHSPSCEAVDQKLVDKAQVALSQAQSTAGSTLDISL